MFKYSIFNNTVKKLNISESKSAGNHYDMMETSETIRNEITTIAKNTENIKDISIHVPKHLKPANNTEFGHYLAGLIDGDGHFSSAQQLVIVFNALDIGLAYYVKEQIGHGKVRKVKNKNAVVFILANRKGIEIVINLINYKFRTTSKFDQITSNILANSKYIEFSKTLNLSLNISNNLENH